MDASMRKISAMFALRTKALVSGIVDKGEELKQAA
jgi:hypothetical protein